MQSPNSSAYHTLMALNSRSKKTRRRSLPISQRYFYLRVRIANLYQFYGALWFEWFYTVQPAAAMQVTRKSNSRVDTAVNYTVYNQVLEINLIQIFIETYSTFLWRISNIIIWSNDWLTPKCATAWCIQGFLWWVLSHDIRDHGFSWNSEKLSKNSAFQFHVEGTLNWKTSHASLREVHVSKNTLPSSFQNSVGSIDLPVGH